MHLGRPNVLMGIRFFASPSGVMVLYAVAFFFKARREANVACGSANIGEGHWFFGAGALTFFRGFSLHDKSLILVLLQCESSA